jgi:hypothetical protein
MALCKDVCLARSPRINPPSDQHGVAATKEHHTNSDLIRRATRQAAEAKKGLTLNESRE